MKVIRSVAEAVARGELSTTLVATAEGEIDDAKRTLNKMIKKLRQFSTNVLQVTQQVGSMGNLEERADLADVEGTWKDVTVGVNKMANQLTLQTRNVASVTTGITEGDMVPQEIPAEAQGAPLC